MADHHAPVEVSQEEVARARGLWNSFTKILTVVVVAAAVTLLLMAFFLA